MKGLFLVHIQLQFQIKRPQASLSSDGICMTCLSFYSAFNIFAQLPHLCIFPNANSDAGLDWMFPCIVVEIEEMLNPMAVMGIFHSWF